MTSRKECKCEGGIDSHFSCPFPSPSKIKETMRGSATAVVLRLARRELVDRIASGGLAGVAGRGGNGSGSGGAAASAVFWAASHQVRSVASSSGSALSPKSSFASSLLAASSSSSRFGTAATAIIGGTRCKVY